MPKLRKVLQSLFVQAPLGALLNLVRLLFVLLFGPLALLAGLIEWLREFLKRMNFKEEEEDEEECNPPAPEGAMRRPDPCIYSQSFLASQGLPVTWDNPDIWMAKAATPNVIEPDSYHLEADTAYIVSVRCHNASTDLALGVKVRLLYRPWSFNSPDLLPVDVNASGQEVVRFVGRGLLRADTDRVGLASGLPGLSAEARSGVIVAEDEELFRVRLHILAGIAVHDLYGHTRLSTDET